VASFQFDHNNLPMAISDDGQTLNRAIRPANAVDNGQAQTVRVNMSDRSSWQQHGGPATAGASVHSVQLQQPDNRVAIAGTSVEPEVYETLKKTSPSLFEPEGAKQAREAAAQADAQAAEDATAEMNTHPDAFVEESHTQFTNVVPAELQIELLVQMNRDGVPSQGTLQRVAESLGVSVDDAVTRLNAMSAGVQAQVIVLAKARGVNPEQFSNWARDNRRGESLRAMQGHVQSRNLLSWDGLINEFKARGQK
jgi:hypothetical protein